MASIIYNLCLKGYNRCEIVNVVDNCFLTNVDFMNNS